MYGSPAIRSKNTLIAWAAIPLALAVLTGSAERSEASILQAGVLANIDDVLMLADQSASMVSSAAPSENSGSVPTQPPAEDSPAAPFALNHGAPTSGGSTSPSSSGAFAGGAMSCLISAQIVVNKDDTTTRLAIGQSISLPVTLGIDLLRPPQP